MRHDASDMDYLEALLHTARDAGAGIMRIYDEMAQTNQPQWTHKADSSPLTQADLQAHLCLVAGLTRLTPEIPVVSEEDSASWAHRTTQGQFWLIDPLDGTNMMILKTAIDHSFELNNLISY
jgi:3'(2'), 5'-bisphosphate nucleotidase